MIRCRRICASAGTLGVALSLFGTPSLPAGATALRAATRPIADEARGGVVGAVDDRKVSALSGDLPRALARSVDRGKISDEAFIPHIMLGLKRQPAVQAAFDELAREQQVRGSAAYHKWLRPEDLARYAPAKADIAKVVAWLQRHGLKVNSVARSGMSIDFAGSSGAVAAAFHTEIHNVVRGREAHVSAVKAPEIPAALTPIVNGVTLSNFFPIPAFTKRTPAFTVPTPFGSFLAVAPADFDTIYNVNPLLGSDNAYGQPITGAGVTIAVVEQTLISASDVRTFRSAFGLSGYGGTLEFTHPGGCSSPGTTGDEGEAALDAEWSGALAPAATIVEASCAGTAPFEFGVMTTLQNLVENATPATIFSISYEYPETEAGVNFQADWTNLVEEAATEGISVFVAAGDNGVSADRNEIDSDGLFVNGLADTAYNVSVGGTDFHDTALGETSSYWKAYNNSNFESALSYVPEIPWDNSCSNSIIASYEGYSDPIAFCNSSNDLPVQDGVGGSGSQSVYYEKPSWQTTTSLGMANDGVRDQPDVSLFAANGIWDHFYVFCMSDANEGGSPCTYTNYNDVFGNAAGGTSFGAPAFAGIMALIQEAVNGSTGLGNPAPALYETAVNQYKLPLLQKNCNSSLGNKISSACVFNYTTSSSIAEPCYTRTPNCVADATSTGLGIGILEAGKKVAYGTGIGYNLATGLGTPNVTNLLYSYP